MAIDKTRKLLSAREDDLISPMAAFGKWWKGVDLVNRGLILLGLLFFILGFADLLRPLVGLFPILFWTNDAFVIIGGLILIAAGISYALRNEK